MSNNLALSDALMPSCAPDRSAFYSAWQLDNIHASIIQSDQLNEWAECAGTNYGVDRDID